MADSPEFPNISGAGHPLHQQPIGEGGKYETNEDKRHTAEPHGTLRNAAERLNLDTPALKSAKYWRDRPKFPNIFNAGRPQQPIGEGGKYETTEDKRRTAEPYGALRRACIYTTRPGIRHISAAPLPQYRLFLAPGTPSPTPNWARGWNTKPPHTKRHTAEAQGTPKFGRTALGSAVFWPTPSKFTNIFGAGQPSPNTQLGKVGMRNYRRRKPHRGTPRNVAGRLNSAA